MKVKVGYITRWRRAIFFTLVACIVVFGLVSTVCAKLIEAALVSNMVSVAALLLCIVVFVLVLSDKWERFEGEGIAAIENGEFTYHDKKRHIEIAMDDIKSVDIKPITLGQTSKTNLAYLLVIKTNKKKYQIESERARGQAYDEVDLHRLYIWIQAVSYTHLTLPTNSLV